MSDAVIQVDHVWKKFRKGEVHDSLRELIPALFKRMTGHKPPKNELNKQEFWALRDVNFEVNRGESLGIIGPNGAGKSTMLKLLSRILKPNRGEYRINGRISALIEVGAGFHPDLTGRENIYLNGTILGMSKSEVKAKEEAIIDFSGVEQFIDTPVKRYSSGMTARLGFAVAAHMEPDVLLVDEVLSVGDARFRQKCISHMRELMRSNVTIIFISHVLDQVRTLCSRTIVLNRGEVDFEGPSDLAIRRYLDVLESSSPHADSSKAVGAEAVDMRVCNGDGEEVLAWEVGGTGLLEIDVVLHRPFKDFALLLNFESISGQYVGTATSALQGLTPGPTKPGRYTLRYLMDPMPFGAGDFSVNMQIHEGDMQRECVWGSHHPRTLSVRGGYAGGIASCLGQWEVVLAKPAMPCPSELQNESVDHLEPVRRS